MKVENYYFTEKKAYPKELVEEYCLAHDLTVDKVLEYLKAMEDADEAS